MVVYVWIALGSSPPLCTVSSETTAVGLRKSLRGGSGASGSHYALGPYNTVDPIWF